MNEKLKALYEKRKKAKEDAKRLNDEAEARCEKDGGDFTADENSAIKRALDDYDSLGQRIENEERRHEQERAEAAASDIADDLNRSTPEKDLEGSAEGNREARERLEVRAAEMWFVANSRDKETHERFAGEIETVQTAIKAGELRALQMDQDIYGGYMVAPTQMATRFIQAVDDGFPWRQFCHVETLTGAHSLGAVSLDTDPDDADWGSEVGAITFDSSMAFGGRELAPHAIEKGIKVAIKLLRNSSRPIEALVRERQAYKIGVPLENAYMTGTGANQPLGIFTADSAGISTSRDVSTDNLTTKPTFDNAKRVKYTLKAQYWPRARWLMHRDVALEYALIKDGEGRYIWADSVRTGEPDRLLGFPVSLSEYAPNTLTTGLYVGILGDPQFYWGADSNQITFTRLDELYRVNKQVGFLSEGAFDGMPVLEEAFVRVKLA